MRLRVRLHAIESQSFLLPAFTLPKGKKKGEKERIIFIELLVEHI
jgi:hypothetical protein